jgi:hypothetical protein
MYIHLTREGGDENDVTAHGPVGEMPTVAFSSAQAYFAAVEGGP